MTLDDGGARGWSSGGDNVAGSAFLQIRLGLGGDWRHCSGEPRHLCPSPHLLLFGTVRWGAIDQESVERPRSGRSQGVRFGRWANSVEINSNILHLDLNLYFRL